MVECTLKSINTVSTLNINNCISCNLKNKSVVSNINLKNDITSCLYHDDLYIILYVNQGFAFKNATIKDLINNFTLMSDLINSFSTVGDIANYKIKVERSINE